jgi:hypothetical protein
LSSSLQALRRADQIEYAEGKVTRDYFLPIVADAGEWAQPAATESACSQPLLLVRCWSAGLPRPAVLLVVFPAWQHNKQQSGRTRPQLQQRRLQQRLTTMAGLPWLLCICVG